MKNVQRIRQKAGRSFCYVLIICLLNTVIDSPASFGDGSALNGQFATDEIESIYEWVMEEVAGIENAVPENGDDSSDFQDIQKYKYDWVHQTISPGQLHSNQLLFLYGNLPDGDLLSFVFENTGPPPEIVNATAI